MQVFRFAHMAKALPPTVPAQRPGSRVAAAAAACDGMLQFARHAVQACQAPGPGVGPAAGPAQHAKSGGASVRLRFAEAAGVAPAA